MSVDEERGQIALVVDRLAVEHAGLPRDRVEQIVHEVHATFEAGGARFRSTAGRTVRQARYRSAGVAARLVVPSARTTR